MSVFLYSLLLHSYVICQQAKFKLAVQCANYRELHRGDGNSSPSPSIPAEYFSHHSSILLSVQQMKINRMCTLCRCKSTPTRKTKLLWMTSYTTGQPKALSSSWVRQQSENAKASGPCAPDPWPLNPKSIGFDTWSCTYSDQRFSSNRAKIHTHTRTSWQSDRNIHAAVYYIVGAITLLVLSRCRAYVCGCVC